MTILRLWSQVNIPFSSASDSAITNNTILNTPITACASTLYTLSNPNKAD